MHIKMPRAGQRRALVVVDAQPATLGTGAAHEVLDVLRAYGAGAPYDAYILAAFSAPEESMFFRQLRWTLSAEAAGPSDPVIEKTLRESGKPFLQLDKTVRSVFKADSQTVQTFLRDNHIDELHFAGFDINDCVLASAYDALDQGYFSYVIEECSGRTDANPEVIGAALTVLRKQAMTNTTMRHAWIEVAI